MIFSDLITKMTSAAVAGNGADVASCFTEDGVYHDVFYGAFKGSEIADLIENYFHRDATNFRWDLHDAVEQNDVGYCRYIFSYDSKLEGVSGRRAGFEGIITCKLKDGKILEYQEVATAGTGLHMLGFSAVKIAKFVAKEANELASRSESAGHFD